MPKLVLDRRAVDNAYFHPDFHGALSAGVDYLDRAYGPEAVRDYLRRFALTYYAPVRRALVERGLEALAEHLRSVYERESGQVEITCTHDSLVLKAPECPAVRHMRGRGYRVARLWAETISAVNEGLCAGTPYVSEFLSYNPDTGASLQLFRRRLP